MNATLPTNYRLVGRDQELKAVLHALGTGESLLVLQGPPGVGKTTLAREVAMHLRSSGASCVSLSLDTCTTRADVLGEVTRALSLPHRSADEVVTFERLALHLENNRSVLLLDGIETVTAPLSALLDDLLDAVPHLQTLVCSWRRLASGAQLVIPIAPLPMRDATALLTLRVARLAPQRTLSVPHAEQLAARAAGLPLAIELLAAHVASLGTTAVVEALAADELPFDALDKALDHAWAQLSASARDALANLSVFRGRFSVAAARAVVNAPDADERLAGLVAASLVDTSEDEHGLRFALLDGVRAYAARRATERALVATARARHATFYAAIPKPRPDDRQARLQLEADRIDLHAAWTWALENNPAAARRLAGCLDLVLATSGPPSAHRQVLEQTVACESPPPLEPATVDLFHALGRIDALRGRHAAALKAFEQALRIAEQLDDPTRLGWSCAYVCYSARPLGHLDHARRAGARALTLGQTTRDARLSAQAEVALGCVELAANQPERACEHHQRALAIAQHAAAPRLIGIAFGNLALDHQACGRFLEAQAALTEARAAFGRGDDAFHLGRVAAQEGALVVALGRLDEGEQLLLRALQDVMEQGDLTGELEAREGLLVVACARADRGLASRRFDELSGVAALIDDVAWPAKLEALRERVARLSTAIAHGHELKLTSDGRVVWLDGQALDFSRRGPLRRILVALAQAQRPLSVAQVQEVGWPGEKMLHESGLARVYMAIRRLRALGLESVLRTSDEGYALTDALEVKWLPLTG